MTTSSPNQIPGTQFINPIVAQTVAGTWQGDVTATRADSDKAGERVFVTTSDGVQLILTATEAADLGESLQKVSGMATSTYGARFLAEVYREKFARGGITQTKASREAGIPKGRLRRLLRGELPMTMTEHKALSEVSA